MAYLCGALLIVLALFLLLPIAVSAVVGDGAVRGLLISLGVMVAVGLVSIIVLGRHHSGLISQRDSFLITAVAWIVVPIVGTLPYILTNAETNILNALFESVSGFTTTGSSVYGNPEEIPISVLIWRSLTQWIGGLGLMLFIIATMRGLKVGSINLYGAEFSGTAQRKLHPRISTSVGYMWTVYLLFTTILIVGLASTGSNLCDAFCLALSTVSTGGFVPSAKSMASLSNSGMAILTVFMFLSGVNVALLYHLIRGKGRQLLRDEEFKVYCSVYIFAVGSCIVAMILSGNDIDTGITYPFFHIASTISTCGYYLDKPVIWSQWLSATTFLLIITGASAGSTGGGIKLKRLMILLRYVNNYFTRMIHPNAVFCVKLNGKAVQPEYTSKVFAFVFVYVVFVIVGGFVLTFCGYDIPMSLCISAANIGNLGPSPIINSMGVGIDYATMPALGKMVLIVLMTAGRIEIFALLSLFVVKK